MSEKVELIKKWVEKYIDPYLEEEINKITIFQSEAIELKSIISTEVRNNLKVN